MIHVIHIRCNTSNKYNSFEVEWKQFCQELTHTLSVSKREPGVTSFSLSERPFYFLRYALGYDLRYANISASHCKSRT